MGMSKIGLYFNTIKHLKPSQVFYRVWRKSGGKTPLKVGYVPNPDVARADVRRAPTLPELDFDPVFLARFDVDAILEDRVELLHHEESVDWDASWHADLSTPLWRFNLHYFEYLMPLGKAYLDSSDRKYLDKAKVIIRAWIGSCPQAKGGPAWDSYTISMRVVNWLAFYGELRDQLDEDAVFVEFFNHSLAEQFAYLACHLEVDLLANHYLEDLKALVILSCYFDDEETLSLALPKLMGQVKEQILPDGMHFELSPMYHKIILEDLMRVAFVLDAYNCVDSRLRKDLRLKDMCDCLYSLERNTSRTPLFNDCGDNVAKSWSALLLAAEKYFDISPTFKSYFPFAGYCIYEHQWVDGNLKVIFDVGKPNPCFAMGHAHCDALSFECYLDGVPRIVNCGTYAYQDDSRLSYKASKSHSTIFVDGHEQNECWGAFRVARFGKCIDVNITNDGISASYRTVDGLVLKRDIRFAGANIQIRDEVEGYDGPWQSIFVFPDLHNSEKYDFDFIYTKNCKDAEPNRITRIPVAYSSDFGKAKEAVAMVCEHDSEDGGMIDIVFSKTENEAK